MSKPLSMCPKCRKVIRRISMSGGSVVFQGLPVPDPEDFCIVMHPCRCTADKHDNAFQAFINAWRQAYEIPEVRAPGAVAAVPNLPTAATAPGATSR